MKTRHFNIYDSIGCYELTKLFIALFSNIIIVDNLKDYLQETIN